MKLAKETWIIMGIGVADLATTIIFIRQHGAVEANPLFKHYWEMGLVFFIAAKMALLVAPLSLLEWARLHKPRFVSYALRCAIVAYIVMYGIGFVKLNQVPPQDLDMSDLTTEGVVLPPRMAGHVRPVMQAIKQTSSATQPDSGASNVAVY